MSQKQRNIVDILLRQGELQSSALHAALQKKGDDASLVTVKRTLSAMVERGVLTVSGSGRATRYAVATLGRLFADIDAEDYCAVEPDQRYGRERFNDRLLPELPAELFTTDELHVLDSATADYTRRTADLPAAIQKKELERLIIELAWKSSKIEGNTYTLLDTEKLILEHTEAAGHTRQEALMILNHKDAFTFIHEHTELFTTLNRANLEKVHAVVVHNLNVGLGLRTRPVGVVGSKYRPLDTGYQISEAVEALGEAVSRLTTPYAKALIALLGISYIQPFEDGNKRTARLMANALLLAHGCAPLSYRSVGENEYREAVLVFYEINSLMPFKKLFIDQYEFAARNYAVK